MPSPHCQFLGRVYNFQRQNKVVPSMNLWAVPLRDQAQLKTAIVLRFDSANERAANFIAAKIAIISTYSVVYLLNCVPIRRKYTS